jgi:hypothetical protein
MFEATDAIHIARNKECLRGDQAPLTTISYSVPEP